MSKIKIKGFQPMPRRYQNAERFGGIFNLRAPKLRARFINGRDYRRKRAHKNEIALQSRKRNRRR